MKPNPAIESLLKEKRRHVLALIDDMKAWLDVERQLMSEGAGPTLHFDRIRDGGCNIYALLAQYNALREAARLDERSRRESRKPKGVKP